MMVIASIFFGLMDTDWASGGKPWYYFGASPELFTVLAAGSGAALVAVVWALFIYKPRHRHSHRRPLGFSRGPERVSAPSSNGHNGAERQASRHRRPWRRKQREHRSRNPTLAERGGLPPLRSERPQEPLP